MIAKLTGTLDSVGADHAVIDVGGVGYLVYCAGRTLARLGGPGAAVTLSIETHVREDHIHLFGFADGRERELFRLLLTVQGVGARGALALLHALGPDGVIQAVQAGDRTALCRADGVGPKLATRAITELRERVGALPVSVRSGADQSRTTRTAADAVPEASAKDSAEPAASGRRRSAKGRSGEDAAAEQKAAKRAVVHDDAVSALVNLGYGRSEAWGAVQAALDGLGEEAALSDVIRAGLKQLSRVETEPNPVAETASGSTGGRL